jgi:glutamate dehydrogenase (NAD(P)+)
MAREVRVLVVEDDPVFRKLLTFQLGACQDPRFKVEQAVDLAGALQLLATGGIEAAVLDMTLPDGAGADLVTRLRAAGLKGPLVVLSGHDDRALQADCLANGATAYVLKGNADAAKLGPLLAS